MTGALTYAAQQEHVNDLHAAAAKHRRSPRRPSGKRRLPALPGLLRPRRALAA
ncbi:MAG TPA: hypothetical protein VGW14_00345 [Thermoleophilaceae bacterium]|nr:hypothetical protein [Thermoleophilaceae bacterium]